MNKLLKQVSCDPECGFMLRSHDEKELIGMVKEHATNAHKMNMSDNDVKARMKSV